MRGPEGIGDETLLRGTREEVQDPRVGPHSYTSPSVFVFVSIVPRLPPSSEPPELFYVLQHPLY